jgi:glycosyltransferase involved in cell wall biosynthesis
VIAGPLVSVNIPCYRQLDLARRAIESVLAQSLTDLEIILHDDGASEEYESYVESLRDPRVRYQRNRERLGAMRNMFAALESGHGKYTMSFHEDDLMSADYIAAAVGVLEGHPTCGFVACDLREFDEEPSADELRKPAPRPGFDLFWNGADFVRGILRGVEPMFGSVVYRRAALEYVHPHHGAYATLVDRPFLLSVIKRCWMAAVIREPLVWYRRHGSDDMRHLAMTSDHVLRLLRAYRRRLPERWTRQDQQLFFSYTGYWLFELYRLTPPDHRPAVWRYLFRAWRMGLYNPRARGRSGLRQIQRAVFNQPS